MEEMQTGHVMVTKAYAADAAKRGIIYPPDWVLDDDQAGENEARPTQQTYHVPTRQTIMRTYVVTAESHEEAKAMVQSMIDNWEDDERADMNVEDLSDERLCGGSERMDDEMTDCDHCGSPIAFLDARWFAGPDPDGDRVKLCSECAKSAGLENGPDD